MATTSVLFVCLGNICRSPMADALLRHKLQQRGMRDQFEVDSAGTAAYHEGEPPDPRTVEVLRRHGIRSVGRARAIHDADFTSFDHILAMDGSNLAALEQRCPPEEAHRLHRTLDPTTGGDVPDPYYGAGDGFETVYQMLDEALDAWLDRWT